MCVGLPRRFVRVFRFIAPYRPPRTCAPGEQFNTRTRAACFDNRVDFIWLAGMLPLSGLKVVYLRPSRLQRASVFAAETK